MALYLDTANVDEVVQALFLPFLHGVTTNPALVRLALQGAGTGGPHSIEESETSAYDPELRLYSKILHVLGPNRKLFVQLPAGSASEILASAHGYAALGAQRLVFKIPCTWEGLRAASLLTHEGLATAITSVFTPEQAYVSSLTGAQFIIPYVNRAARTDMDVVGLLDGMARALKAAGGTTRLLAASLRSRKDARLALACGADDLSVPAGMLRELVEHPATRAVVQEFEESSRFIEQLRGQRSGATSKA